MEGSMTSLSSLLREFRDFVMRGNIVELAVAFVMGLAFAAVVNSLVNNLVMPLITTIIGKPDFRDLTFTLHRSVWRYGAFITDVIQFAAIAAAVFFFIVKPMAMILARRAVGVDEEAPPSDDERRHQELLTALREISR
jgi:large conductance mechanosensitive channel